MANDCIGEEVEKLAASLPNGSVLLLENVRFYKEEEKNDPEFAKKLASVAALYVNDAFGTAHRAHASTEGVPKSLKPAVAGFLMQKVLLKFLCLWICWLWCYLYVDWYIYIQ
jgi:phosphoglycerate kinase